MNNETDQRIRAMFPRGSQAFYDANADPRLQGAKPERDAGKTLERPLQAQKGSALRTTLRIIGFRCRPLDPDNFCGGAKQIIDCLREAELIDGDSPEHITLITEQVKVAHRGEERTKIVIEYL